ncbi:MAG TPA: fasciclin domain-containing protein [Nostocaceae cyanobacterium]|nr:fasciclin domain-containing protein [Nostocaceae cyanobacterium]
MKAFSRSLLKTAGIAIAASALLINTPTFAKKPKRVEVIPVPTSTTTVTTVGTLVEVARTNTCGCNTFVSAVRTAGLVEILSSTRTSYTVFVPSDAAFAALPPGTLEKLLKPENRPILQQILAYHVLYGSFDHKKIKPGKIKTYGGKLVEIKFKKNHIEIGKAKFKKFDLKAKNGYIHLIDTVLIPPDLVLL